MSGSKKNESLFLYADTADSYGHYSFVIDFVSAKESFPCDQKNESKKNKIQFDTLYYGQLGYGKTSYTTAYNKSYEFIMPSDGAINVEISQWEPRNDYGIKTETYDFIYTIYQGLKSTRWVKSGKSISNRAVLKKGIYYLSDPAHVCNF